MPEARLERTRQAYQEKRLYFSQQFDPNKWEGLGDPCPRREGREHDYRSRLRDGSYRAICLFCDHDAGVIDFTGWDTVDGVGYFRSDMIK